MTQTLSTRRYDLDWLRVIAFGLLIFYHVGMYYVPWDWHVKSPYAGEFLEPAMMLLNPWRLSLLFVISGVAVKFAVDKAVQDRFAWNRFKRLFVPLVFGMFVIVAPQSYFELRSEGVIEPGYWAFYQDYVRFDQKWELFTPTYNHLWYVLYVLIYTLVAVPFLGLLRGRGGLAFFRRMMGTPAILLVPVLPFVLYRFTTDIWSPETHDIMKDVGAHVRYGSYFLIGILVAKSDAFWRGIAAYWKWSLGLAVLAGMVLTPVWANWEGMVVDSAEMQAARALRIFYIWWVICALFGAGQAFLNRPGKLLAYLTEAVFPYYILHQTLIILAGVFLAGYRVGAVPEFLGVTLLTVLGCVLLHEYVIRRVPLLRPLFGLRPKPRQREAEKVAA